MKISFTEDIELLQILKTEMLLKMQDSVNQMRSSVEGLLSRINDVEGRPSSPKDMVEQIKYVVRSIINLEKNINMY